VYFNLYVPRQQREDRNCEPNGSKRSPNSVCSWSLRACKFDLLVFFRGIWTLQHIQKISQINIACNYRKISERWIEKSARKWSWPDVSKYPVCLVELRETQEDRKSCKHGQRVLTRVSPFSRWSVSTHDTYLMTWCININETVLTWNVWAKLRRSRPSRPVFLKYRIRIPVTFYLSLSSRLL
jgi:hypothetical protein